MNCHPSKPCPQASTCVHHQGQGTRIDGTRALIRGACWLYVSTKHPAVQQKAAA